MYSYYSRKFDSGFPTSIMTSQVEISSRSPFGNVLKDRGRGDIWGRDRSSIQKNFKNLVESRVPQKPKDSNVDSVQDSNRVDSVNKNDNNKKNEKISKGSEKWARAREMVFETETSPAQSDSGEIRKIRVVSSLVQKWRDFEAESKNVNKNNNSGNNNPSVCSSRSNSSSIFSEISTVNEAHLRNSDVTESAVHKSYEKPTITVDTNFDSESDRISISGPPSTRSRDSNATESERNRVADIIKRLTTMNGEECHDRDQTISSDPLLKIRTDHSPKSGGNAVLIASPRIRGRHALNDLLMQMERDRYREIQGLGECKVVSKFPHRCRIKTLLRVRFLRQGIDAKDGSKTSPTESEKTKHTQGSSITHLRERFNTEHSEAELSPRKPPRKSSASNQKKEVVDHNANSKKNSISNQHKGKTRPQEVTQPGSPLHRKVVDSIQEMVPCSASNCQKIDMSHAGLKSPHHNHCQLQKSENDLKECTPSSDLMCKSTSYELKRLNSQELADMTAKSRRSKGNNFEERMARKHQSIASLDDWIKEISPPRSDLEDHQEASEGHLVESGPEWTSDFSQNPSEWEEEEASSYQLEENSQEWIYDIARPRSDWEGLRQERYQEMLDPFVKNGDIKQLLERRSVSTFLTSELRDRIDQIMISRIQAKQRVIVNRAGKNISEKEAHEKRMESKNIEEEENKSPVGHREAAEYFEQTPSSLCSASPLVYSSWARNPIHSPTDESVSAPSSIEQSPSSISCTRDNKLSLEMELIYGLKGHVEQIHQEIADLRRALTTCINMQVQSQNFVKPGPADSFIQPVAREKGNESFSRTPRKGICCLCFESEVDSLLYRCGHMCTCFKCAQELQWDSGKCPICRASIQDVVRTYPDYRVTV